MPTIVFRVNLNTLNFYSGKQPFHLDTEGVNFPYTRSTWFPDILRDNRQLKHGDQFTMTGTDALYLMNNYTSGDAAFLEVVSYTP